MKEPEFGEPLLRYLRRLSERPGLQYREPPTPIALGTEAWILGFSLQGAPAGLDGPLVLRAMHSQDDRYQVAIEHAVQNAVAEQGFPAPKVLGSSDTGEDLGWPFLVMQRLPGDLRPDLPDVIELQMKTLAKLHDLDPKPIELSMQAHGVPVGRYSGSSRTMLAAAQIEKWDLGRLRPVMEWLEVRTPANSRLSICHGDPHLYNMLILNGEISAMIDWGTARLNHPEMDVGLLCGYARSDGFPSSVERDPQQQAVDRLIVAYERHRAIDHERVLYFETEFLVSVLVDMTDRHLRRAAGEVVAGNPLLDDPDTADRVRSRLAAVSSLPVPTPQEVVRRR